MVWNFVYYIQIFIVVCYWYCCRVIVALHSLVNGWQRRLAACPPGWSALGCPRLPPRLSPPHPDEPSPPSAPLLLADRCTGGSVDRRRLWYTNGDRDRVVAAFSSRSRECSNPRPLPAHSGPVNSGSMLKARSSGCCWIVACVHYGGAQWGCCGLRDRRCTALGARRARTSRLGQRCPCSSANRQGKRFSVCLYHYSIARGCALFCCAFGNYAGGLGVTSRGSVAKSPRGLHLGSGRLPERSMLLTNTRSFPKTRMSTPLGWQHTLQLTHLILSLHTLWGKKKKKFHSRCYSICTDRELSILSIELSFIIISFFSSFFSPFVSFQMLFSLGS